MQMLHFEKLGIFGLLISDSQYYYQHHQAKLYPRGVANIP